MKLIVGLGNPDRKYQGTRHNVGFDVVTELASRHAAGKPKVRFKGLTAEANIGREKVLLLEPHTYMNLSGTSVQPALAFYKLGIEDLLVVCDDINLPLARLRFRARGSAGGQKGLADIIRRLGNDEFSRLRVGVGAPPEHWNAADFVLSKFGPDEANQITDAVARAAAAAADWVEHGIEYSMNQYNGS